MNDFYTQTVMQLVEKGLMSRDMSILVVCGGATDQATLINAGFKDVTISNLDVRMRGDEFAPFRWSFQDAENLEFSDGSFDFCISHNGLHHCYSPHRALLEMHRVARRGILVFEPHDSFWVRLGVKFKFGQEYEVAAVAKSDLMFGGVKNTDIPNYVYRWTEREIEKTVCSCAPAGRPRFHYFYALRVPRERLEMLKDRIIPNLLRVALPFLRISSRLFPRQCNNFAFAIEKIDVRSDLHPWLKLSGGRPAIDRKWVTTHYSV